MQDARRTALTPHGPADQGDVVAAPSRRVGLLAAVAVVALVVDQVTKYLAVEHLAGRAPQPLVGDLLKLTLVRNPGAAFSTGTGLTPVFAVFAIVVALGVLWISRRVSSTLWAVGLGFLLAGVVGNLIDRILRQPGPFHGHVVDFLMLPHWPVFNVADICINVAAVVIVVQGLRGIRLDGTRSANS